jgi:large subunit ribosomal protein L10
MNREEKSAAIQEIAVQIEGAEAIFAVDYRGITVSQAAELRSKLRETDASFRVVKNRLTKIAANQVGEERLPELLVGPTALTFVRGDTAAAAKAITTFNKEHDVLTFKGGFMEDIVLDEESFKAIAKLPSREVLIGQLAGVVASPLTGLVRGLGALIGGLALQLGQIAEKGLVTGEAPAAKDESAAVAGPVADETSAASSAEDPSSAPPAADAESADAETPAAEEKADESSSDNEASEAEGETADADDNTAKEEEE